MVADTKKPDSSLSLDEAIRLMKSDAAAIIARGKPFTDKEIDDIVKAVYLSTFARLISTYGITTARGITNAIYPDPTPIVLAEVCSFGIHVNGNSHNAEKLARPALWHGGNTVFILRFGTDAKDYFWLPRENQPLLKSL